MVSTSKAGGQARELREMNPGSMWSLPKQEQLTAIDGEQGKKAEIGQNWDIQKYLCIPGHLETHEHI